MDLQGALKATPPTGIMVGRRPTSLMATIHAKDWQQVCPSGLDGRSCQVKNTHTRN